MGMKSHVCNMVASINNGQLAKKAFITQPFKNVSKSILDVLWDEGFILGYKVSKQSPKTLKIYLKYQNGVSAINLIKMLSKPSLKLHYSIKQLWKLNSNNGLIILSTDRGIMSNIQCKKYNIGGEPFIIVK